MTWVLTIASCTPSVVSLSIWSQRLNRGQTNQGGYIGLFLDDRAVLVYHTVAGDRWDTVNEFNLGGVYVPGCVLQQPQGYDRERRVRSHRVPRRHHQGLRPSQLCTTELQVQRSA